MYNGIGITSARGSGSSGYVQSNKFNVRRRTNRYQDAYEKEERSLHRKPNKEILEHEQKRKIELEVFKLRDKLEDDGVSEEEIEKQVGELRERLVEEQKKGKGLFEDKASRETHAVANRKSRQMQNLAQALRVRPDLKEGEAFDRDLQEQRKRERIAQREQRQREWEKEREARRKISREMREPREESPRPSGTRTSSPPGAEQLDNTVGGREEGRKKTVDKRQYIGERRDASRSHKRGRSRSKTRSSRSRSYSYSYSSYSRSRSRSRSGRSGSYSYSYSYSRSPSPSKK